MSNSSSPLYSILIFLFIDLWPTRGKYLHITISPWPLWNCFLCRKVLVLIQVYKSSTSQTAMSSLHSVCAVKQDWLSLSNSEGLLSEADIPCEKKLLLLFSLGLNKNYKIGSGERYTVLSSLLKITTYITSYK